MNLEQMEDVKTDRMTESSRRGTYMAGKKICKKVRSMMAAVLATALIPMTVSAENVQDTLAKQEMETAIETAGEIVEEIQIPEMLQSVTVNGRWVQSGGYWYFLQTNGQYVKNSTLTIGGSTYYFDANGRMKTGWYNAGGDIWYYFSSSGAMVTGWKKIDGKWYYFHEADSVESGKGFMYSGKIFSETEGIAEIADVLYRFDSNGSIYVGWYTYNGLSMYFSVNGAVDSGWVSIGGTYYYFKDGNVQKTGFTPIGDKVYFLDLSSGAMVTGWMSLGGSWYYFSGSGEMVTEWNKIGGKWYYLDPSTGIMVTGWLPEGGHAYYLNPSSGAMLTGWQKIDGEWYYFNGSGYLQTGWQKVNNVWYLLDFETGVMVTGWSTDEKGNTYYLNPSSGDMVTGWQKIEGYDYYFNAGGVLQKDAWIGNYYVDESGRWIPGKTK